MMNQTRYARIQPSVAPLRSVEGTRAVTTRMFRPQTVESLFTDKQQMMASAVAEERRPGLFIFAAHERFGHLARLWLEATDQPRAGTIGRHDEVDLRLPLDDSLSLRHVLFVVRRSEGAVRFAAIDLETTDGLRLETGAAVRLVEATGTLILQASEFTFFCVPTGQPLSWRPEAPRPWATLLPRATCRIEAPGGDDVGRLLEAPKTESTDVVGTIELCGMLPRSHSRVDAAALRRGVLIGRASRCDVVVPIDSVSRVHAVLIQLGDEVLLIDSGSTNGTWAGERRITPRGWPRESRSNSGGKRCCVGDPSTDAKFARAWHGEISMMQALGEADVAAKRGGKGKKATDVLRNDQVVRILRMIRDLDRVGGADLYTLAERYGTTTRTIRRDLEALQESGIPLCKEQSEESSRVRWRLDPDASSKLTNLLETSHFLALRLAMAEAQVLRRNENLFAVMEDIADRIERALGRKGREDLRALDRCFLSWEKFAWREAPPDLMWPLISAISEQRQCVVTYRAPSSGNTEKRFRVLPLRLVVHNGSLYLHAWKEHFKTVLLLNLQRLQKLEVLDERGSVPAEYDPDKLENSAFGIFLGKTTETFKLRFDAFARPYIEERTWHPSQDLVELPDGGAELTFTCTPSYEVTNWVASWQEHVEVLEPKRLRGELLKYGQWLTARYGSEG